MSPIAADDTYAPRSMPWAKIALWWVPLVMMAWSFAVIVEAPASIQTWTVIGGVVAMLAIYWHQWRRWQTHHQMPAALRRNLAGALRSPLPYGSLKTINHRFGSLFKPGAPRKIIIRAEGLTVVDEKMDQEVLRIASEICGSDYVRSKKRSKQGKKIVLREKPREKQVELTNREQIQQRILDAVRDLYPKQSPRVACMWDEGNVDQDYLLEVTISGVPGMELALTGKRRQVLQKLRTRLPTGNFRPSVDDREDLIQFRRSKPLPQVVVPPRQNAALMRSDADYRKFSVPMGIGDDEQQAEWKPVRDAHLLIIGGTGGGKTVAESGVIQRVTQAGWRTWLIDGKQIEFTGYRDWPNVEFLAQTVDSQIRLMKLAMDTMQKRYDLIRDGKVRVADMDPIVLVIDEMTSLLEFVKQRYEETKVSKMPAKSPFLGWYGNLMRLARSAKIHIVTGIQRPDADIIGGEIRDNMGARLSTGPLMSKEGSIMMWDDPAIGVQVPKHPGRGISYVNGVPGQVQTPFTANPNPFGEDYHQGMVEAQRPNKEVYSRKHFAEMEPKVDPEGKEDPVTWHDIIGAEILGPDGQPITIDPVTSDESRALRAERAVAEVPEDIDRLQTATSKEEALQLFAFDPIERLVEGQSVARQLCRWVPTGNTEKPAIAEENPPAAHDELPVPMPMSTGTVTEINAVKEGQYIHLEDLGEDVMVSSCEPTEDDTSTYQVTGYTSDGEAVSVELSADTSVETFDRMEAV